MGLGTWRSNSRESFSSGTFPGAYESSSSPKGKSTAAMATGQWGAIRLEGDDDWSVGGARMRSLGMGIEGRASGSTNTAPKGKGRLSFSMTKAVAGASEERDRGKDKDKSGERQSQVLIEDVSGDANTSGVDRDRDADDAEDAETAAAEAQRQNTQTTLALLQTFHANTVFLLSRLHEILPPPSAISSPAPSPRTPQSQKRTSSVELSSLLPNTRPSASSPSGDGDAELETVPITARDMLSMDLGILSEVDARFVEWLAEAEGYAGKAVRRRVVVRRGWAELVGILFGVR